MNILPIADLQAAQDPSSCSCESRRTFLKTTAATLGGLAAMGTLSEFLASCASISGLTITHGTTSISVASLTSDGEYLVDSSVSPDRTPILVIRHGSGSFVALSMRCTHQGEQVNRPSNGSIYCSAHGSRFDLNGNVTSGPANRALTKYATSYDSSSQMLTITY
jgi:cytochrome b6-f complex iron-sulfur subunit